MLVFSLASYMQRFLQIPESLNDNGFIHKFLTVVHCETFLTVSVHMSLLLSFVIHNGSPKKYKSGIELFHKMMKETWFLVDMTLSQTLSV